MPLGVLHDFSLSFHLVASLLLLSTLGLLLRPRLLHRLRVEQEPPQNVP
jgi:hypothetical protein